MGSRFAGGIQQAAGTADINMRTLRLVLQYFIQLDAIGRIAAVVVEGQVAAEYLLHVVHEGRALGRFGAVVEMEISADRSRAGGPWLTWA